MIYKHDLIEVFDITHAIQTLRPGAIWSVVGDEIYANLEWSDTIQKKPSREEVENEIQRLQDEYEFNKYKKLRKENYPSIADQLDVLYNQGFDVWKENIKAIKDLYPKPYI
jgi:hypothetical protein